MTGATATGGWGCLDMAGPDMVCGWHEDDHPRTAMAGAGPHFEALPPRGARAEPANLPVSLGLGLRCRWQSGLASMPKRGTGIQAARALFDSQRKKASVRLALPQRADLRDERRQVGGAGREEDLATSASGGHADPEQVGGT